MPQCNICNGEYFLDFSGRQLVRCLNCDSLERHRLLRYVLESLGFLDENLATKKKVLHLAPEKMTHNYLSEIYRAGYIAADLFPEKYPHAQVLKLELPQGFNIFPDEYFDLIVHNHVLEHIPGSYKDHLNEFIRVMKQGGYMVFTIPKVNLDKITVEGGELLKDDISRINAHGQSDHFKTFGYDFFEYFADKPGSFNLFEIEATVRERLNAPFDVIYVFNKNEKKITLSTDSGWAAGIEHEISFWRDWLINKGGKYHEDYKFRMNPLSEFGERNFFLKNFKHGETPKVLDVGCGPIPHCGYIKNGVVVDYTGVDPLADEYNKLLDSFGVTIPFRPIALMGEQLLDKFESNTFDLVFARNSLYHSLDPLLCVKNMLIVTKPGHDVRILVHVNEAEYANYSGFHQWNFEFNGDYIRLWNKKYDINLNSELDLYVSDIKVEQTVRDLTIYLTKK